jgi:hypothetical protein
MAFGQNGQVREFGPIREGAHMSYEGNELGYDTGYDSDFVRSSHKPSIQDCQSHAPSVAYWAVGESNPAAVDGSRSLYIPTIGGGDEDKTPVKALKDGKVSEFPNAKAAKDAGASPIQVKLHGRMDGKKDDYLVQYFDDKGNPIKYDEVSGKTATTVLGFKPEELKEAKPIGKESFYANQMSKLQGVEKNKGDDKSVNLVDGSQPTISVADAKAASANGTWEPGGAMHQRLTDYGFTPPEIEYLKKEYTDAQPPLSQSQLNEKIPELSDADKRDKTAVDKKKAEVVEKTQNGIINAQSERLAAKLNAGKSKEDATWLDPKDARALVEQKYREEGAFGENKDGTRTSTLGQFMEKKDKVNNWINKEVPSAEQLKKDNFIKHPSEHPSLAYTWNNAIKAEKEGIVTTLTPYMDGKTKAEQKSNARMYLASMENSMGDQLNSPSEYRAKRDEFAADIKTETGKNALKEKGKVFAEGLKKDPKMHADLALKAGTEEPDKQAEDTLLKGLPQKDRDALRLRMREGQYGAKLEDEKRKKDHADWLQKQETSEQADVRKEERAKANDIAKEKRDELASSGEGKNMGWKKKEKIEEENRAQKNQKQFAVFQMGMQSVLKSIDMMQQSAFNTVAKQQELTAREVDKLEAIKSSIMASLFPQGNTVSRR